MKCPHCKKKFDQICAKLFCPDHGWHELDHDGGIIPADQPTESELKAWNEAIEDEKRSKAFVDRAQELPASTNIDQVENPPGDERSGDIVYLIIGAAIIIIGVIAFRELKKLKQRKAVPTGDKVNFVGSNV